jgi:hypothetical protein
MCAKVSTSLPCRYGVAELVERARFFVYIKTVRILAEYFFGVIYILPNLHKLGRELRCSDLLMKS